MSVDFDVLKYVRECVRLPVCVAFIIQLQKWISW